MLDKEIEKKMKKYNKLRSQADTLEYEIKTYLEDNFGIEEDNGFFEYGEYKRPFSEDGVVPMYDWGTRYFDVPTIKKIIKFIEKFTNDVGERPDIQEISEHFDK